MQQSSQLRVVAAVSRSYDQWTDQQGKARPAGTAHRLWLSEGFGSAPFEASCSPEVFQVAFGHGAAVAHVSVEFSAKNDRLVAKVVDFKTVAASPELVSTNGRK